MKALVTTKFAIDYQVKVMINSTKDDVVKEGVQMSMNPFDAIAVEACVQLQELDHIKSSSVVTIDQSDTVLRQAMAMGIDHGIQIQAHNLDPLPKAQILSQLIQEHDYDLVIMGKLGIDGDHSQIPQMIAGILDWPCATFASNIQVNKDHIIVDRETDDGISSVKLSTPCVISCDLRLNTPRFIALPKLLQAKKQEIEQFTPKIMPTSPFTYPKVLPPPEKKGNPPVKQLDEFIQQLKDGGIIE